MCKRSSASCGGTWVRCETPAPIGNSTCGWKAPILNAPYRRRLRSSSTGGAAGVHFWSSYLVGSSSDGGLGIATGTAGYLLVTGTTGSSGWISGGWDESLGGWEDAFVVRIRSWFLGDYDRNGAVEQDDYANWRSSYGAASGPGLNADGNGDGVVNAADYTVWRDNLDETAPNPAEVFDHETAARTSTQTTPETPERVFATPGATDSRPVSRSPYTPPVRPEGIEAVTGEETLLLLLGENTASFKATDEAPTLKAVDDALADEEPIDLDDLLPKQVALEW